MTVSRNELTAKAQQFIAFLASLEIEGELDTSSFRDYNCKIRLPQGAVILYHKPSKNTFSIGTQEYGGSREEAEKLWHNFVYPHETRAGLCAYVDGSFLNGVCAWGLVLAENEVLLSEQSGLVGISADEGGRQIAGEVTAVLQALEYARANGFKSLEVFFDYKGLQYWAEGKWKAQSPIAQYYCAKLMQYKPLKIHWHKVAAHTGHPLNGRADRLAKLAAEKG